MYIRSNIPFTIHGDISTFVEGDFVDCVRRNGQKEQENSDRGKL